LSCLKAALTALSILPLKSSFASAVVSLSASESSVIVVLFLDLFFCLTAFALALVLALRTLVVLEFLVGRSEWRTPPGSLELSVSEDEEQEEVLEEVRSSPLESGVSFALPDLFFLPLPGAVTCFLHGELILATVLGELLVLAAVSCDFVSAFWSLKAPELSILS
jgi:hypothetical protein